MYVYTCLSNIYVYVFVYIWEVIVSTFVQWYMSLRLRLYSVFYIMICELYIILYKSNTQKYDSATVRVSDLIFKLTKLYFV